MPVHCCSSRIRDEINRLQRIAVEDSRLGIPLLFGFDVIHGLRTILPVPIALAASWDPATIERGQSMAAREARAVGIHWTFAPMVDIARDPRWGRIIEGAGEDPYLGAAVAVAQVRGFQGGELGEADRVIAGPKHFAGYGAALGGRDYDEVNLSDSELWNVYFPPFKAAVDAGAGNVMTAYMDLNGIPASGNAWLFTEVLRDTWGFEGFVVSDSKAVRSLVTHGFAADLTDAAARAVNVGVDMEMTMFDPAYGHLPEALESGAANPEAVDASVRRVLAAKARMGLFDAPYVDEDRAREVLADPAHRDVARIAAERSAVLLRNEGDLLPLDAGSLDVDRGHRAARRLQARHARARGCSTSISTRPSPSSTASGRGSATGCGSTMPAASRGWSACSRHRSTGWTGTPSRIPPRSTRRPSSSAPSISPTLPTSRSSSWASGRT